MRKLPESQRIANRRKSWRKYYWRNRPKRLTLSRELETRKKEQRRKRRAAYYQERKALIPDELKRRYRKAYHAGMNNPAFVLMRRCRSRLIRSLKPSVKVARTSELLGCTQEELVRHIESQFVPGMSWENRVEWHIDHIQPVASFDLLKPDELKACFHFSNLRPLWKAENQSKSDKIIAFRIAA